MEFSAATLIIAALIFFLAAFFHGSIGLGFPMVSTPLLALVTDIRTAIILTVIPTLLVNVVTIVSEGNVFTAFKRFLPLALLAMVGSIIGTFILLFTHTPLFEALLAVAIIAYLFREKLNLNFSWVYQNPRASKIIFGTSAGLLGGLTNVMAPVLIIYSMESRYSKREIIQALNLSFMSGKGIQLVLFSVYGKFSLSTLSTSALMLIAVSAALYLGIKIRKRIDVDTYKKMLQLFLLIISIILLLKVAYNMA
ncbi:MAG: sulfite exporter TauE/SafE family protein [Gammaproteobacteria bacterium]|nr:sulfite exporter TauE/SafE family protein [Gammaproteobacteria bacterium]